MEDFLRAIGSDLVVEGSTFADRPDVVKPHVPCQGCAARQPTSNIPPEPSPDGRIRLAEDLDADSFKAALVGEWVSAWPDPTGSFIERAVFDPNGSATVTYRGEGTQTTVNGRYSVSFGGKLNPHAVTHAEITIIPSMVMTGPAGEGASMAKRDMMLGGEPLILSRVNFGLHNGVLSDEPLLRIDRSSVGTGVLRRAKS